MNIKAFTLYAIFSSILFASLFMGCGDSSEVQQIKIDSTASDTINKEAHTPTHKIREGSYHNARISINHIGNFREVFNDSNKYQYAYAEKIGIDPILDIRNTYYTKRPIVKIVSNEYYHVDELTHSFPYLVPEAAKLLHDIGKNFIDSLAKRGADGYKIKVTSLLRTPATVKRLRRVNVNASDSSTHQFATTFDLSYNHFWCLDSTRTINGNDLKGLLGEVLLDLRKQERCMVKYEYKTACFHITATGK